MTADRDVVTADRDVVRAGRNVVKSRRADGQTGRQADRHVSTAAESTRHSTVQRTEPHMRVAAALRPQPPALLRRSVPEEKGA